MPTTNSKQSTLTPTPGFLGRVLSFTVITLALVFISPEWAWGQELGGTAGGLRGSGATALGAPGQNEMRVITDSDGEELFEGAYISLEGATLTLVDGNNTKESFKMNDLSDEDQKWAKDMKVAAKKFQLAQKEAEKIITTMSNDVGKASALVKGLNRLKKTGMAAAHMAPAIDRYFKHDDAKVRRTAFATYAHICVKSESDMARLMKELRENEPLHEGLKKHPRDFMVAMSKFGDEGMEYLRTVAFDCTLRPKKSPSDEPIQLKVAGGAQSLIRTEACKVMGEFKKESQREYAAEYLMMILEISKKDINGKYEDNTIKASIKSLGELGYYSKSIRKIMTELYKDFPEETKDAMKKLDPPKKEGQQSEKKDDEGKGGGEA